MSLRAQVFCFECCFCIRVFTQSSIVVEEQWWKRVLLSSLLKFWVLFLNYKCPNKCFYFFMASYVIFLNFLRRYPPQFSLHIALRGIRILNTKKKIVRAGSHHLFAKLSLLPLRKNWFYRFPWKTSSDQSKIHTTSLPNFSEGKARKFTVSFAFFVLMLRS